MRASVVFEAGVKAIALMDEAGVISIRPYELLIIESAILTFGHEAAHVRKVYIIEGDTYRPNAERAGLDAVIKFRREFINE